VVKVKASSGVANTKALGTNSNVNNKAGYHNSSLKKYLNSIIHNKDIHTRRLRRFPLGKYLDNSDGVVNRRMVKPKESVNLSKKLVDDRYGYSRSLFLRINIS
jgi:hypothetical protein